MLSAGGEPVFGETTILPDWHVEALEWFQANAGRVFSERPRDVGLQIKVTDPQSGIWKPHGTEHAVSVLQTAKHRYPDMPPYRVQGTWVYHYHQEGPATEAPYKRYTNRSLMKCIVDGVPLGVVLPARTKGPNEYEVLGLGFVDRYENGYFVISGPATVSGADFALKTEAPNETLALITLASEDSPAYQTADDKLRVLASVVRRQGQPHFRRQLIVAYEGRCAMSEYDAEDALEAAHITPYSDSGSNHITNGLLLRSDMHDLFDLGLLAVDISKQTLLMSNKLANTKYERYEGRKLHLPQDRSLWPATERLDQHRELAGL